MNALFALVERRPYATLNTLFGVCVVVFLVAIPLPRVDNALLGNDGVQYYHYTRSLVIDGDLDFSNEYQHFHDVNGLAAAPPVTAAGRPPNHHSIGVGLLWIPFFLVAHALAKLCGLPSAGYTYLYQAAVCLGSMTYVLLGMVLVYRLCREHADAASAVVAVVVMWFASNVVYYMVAEPSMSHSLSFAAVSALLAWWRLYPDRTALRYWIGLGVLGAIAALVRPQDGMFLLLPVIEWLLDGARIVRGRHWRDASRHALRGGLMGAACAAVFCIQLWAWWAVFGAIANSGYFYEGKTVLPHLRHPKIGPVLFSLHHGLFAWHPVYLIGAVGLYGVVRADRRYGLLLALGFAIQVLIVASWTVWSQDDAFGGRVLVCTAPVLTIGLAQVVERVRQRTPRAVVIGGLALIVWNAAFMAQYRFGFIPKDRTITVHQFLTEKLTLPIDAWRRWQHVPGSQPGPEL